MKKNLMLLFALIISESMFAWDHEQVQIDDLFYNLDAANQTAEVTYQNYRTSGNYSSLTTVSIPSSVEYESVKYIVTSIEESTFFDCPNLTSVSFPYTITSIGSSAFAWCSGLTSIEIPSSITSIGSTAFYGCAGLTSITNFATTPQSIDFWVFYGDSSKPAVDKSTCKLYVPEASIDLYREANGWKEFENILPYRCLIASGNCGIDGDNLIWELSCSCVLTIKGTGGMESWSSKEEVPWYSYVETIRHIVIGDSVTSIGNFAFSGCTELTNITIGISVVNIESSAFSGCSKLTGIVNYATTPQSIEYDVFFEVENYSCTLYVPEESIDLYQYANGWNWFLNIVSIDQYSTHIPIGDLYYNLDLEAQTAEVTYLYCADSQGDTNYTYLTEAVIPESIQFEGKDYVVTRIGERAFSSCPNLTYVSLPNSITSIGRNAFNDNINLTNVTIPNGVTKIESNVFSGCPQISSINIPASVVQIGDTGNKPLIRTIIVSSPNLTTLSVEPGNPIYDSRNNCNAIIETATNTLIMGCQNTVIPNTVDTIGLGAFFGCTHLTSLNIPTSVKYVEEAAFHNIGITSLFLSKNTIIADWYNSSSSFMGVFSECENLTSVVFEEGTTAIPNAIFSNCPNLADVSIPNGVTRIGRSAFNECTSLTSVSIPKSVINIENSAFYMCSGLIEFIVDSENPNYSSEDDVLFNKDKTTLILYPGGKHGEYAIPNSVTSIGEWAFSYCSGLASVTIPNSVTSIGERAFWYCDGLTSVINYATTPQEISNYSSVFYNVNTSACTLYVPEKSIQAYQAANVWKDFGNIVAIAETPTAINEVGQEAKTKIQKQIKNGQIFIIRGDKTYTLTGQAVK